MIKTAALDSVLMDLVCGFSLRRGFAPQNVVGFAAESEVSPLHARITKPRIINSH